jgi:hypothetical protein
LLIFLGLLAFLGLLTTLRLLTFLRGIDAEVFRHTGAE